MIDARRQLQQHQGQLFLVARASRAVCHDQASLVFIEVGTLKRPTPRHQVLA